MCQAYFRDDCTISSVLRKPQSATAGTQGTVRISGTHLTENFAGTLTASAGTSAPLVFDKARWIRSCSCSPNTTGTVLIEARESAGGEWFPAGYFSYSSSPEMQQYILPQAAYCKEIRLVQKSGTTNNVVFRFYEGIPLMTTGQYERFQAQSINMASVGSSVSNQSYIYNHDPDNWATCTNRGWIYNQGQGLSSAFWNSDSNALGIFSQSVSAFVLQVPILLKIIGATYTTPATIATDFASAFLFEGTDNVNAVNDQLTTESTTWRRFALLHINHFIGDLNTAASFGVAATTAELVAEDGQPKLNTHAALVFGEIGALHRGEEGGGDYSPVSQYANIDADGHLDAQMALTMPVVIPDGTYLRNTQDNHIIRYDGGVWVDDGVWTAEYDDDEAAALKGQIYEWTFAGGEFRKVRCSMMATTNVATYPSGTLNIAVPEMQLFYLPKYGRIAASSIYFEYNAADGTQQRIDLLDTDCPVDVLTEIYNSANQNAIDAVDVWSETAMNNWSAMGERMMSVGRTNVSNSASSKVWLDEKRYNSSFNAGFQQPWFAVLAENAAGV